MRLERILSPDWRDASAYAYLLDADRVCFAWEWLRRDPEYRTAAIRAPSGRIVPEAVRLTAASWGLHTFENPGLTSLQARPMWTASSYAGVLTAEALPAKNGDSAFELRRLSSFAHLVRSDDGAEHLLLSDGPRLLRVDICAGSVARGRKRLRFHLEGPAGIENRLLTLERFLALARTGSFSSELHRRDYRSRRWVLVLRAADAMADGASQREIAHALLGFELPPTRWRQEDPNIRGRAQRLVQEARRLANGGFAAFLR